MSYKRKTVDKFKHDALIVLFLFFLVSLVPNWVAQASNSELNWPVRPYADVIEIEKEVIVPVEVPIGCETEKCQIMAYIMEKFGDDAADAITIINKCENHAFDPHATNHNRNGTIDRGVFQINSIHGGEELFDWRTNVDAAYKIFSSRGWTAWSCSHVIGVRSFWQ